MRSKDVYTVYLENKTVYEAKELAQKLGMSFSQFVEKALQIYIKKVKKEIGNLMVEDLMKLKEKLSEEQWQLVEEQIRNYILGRWNDGTTKKAD